jgi:hypothetical protein
MEKLEKIYQKIKKIEIDDSNNTEKDILINYFIRKYKNLIEENNSTLSENANNLESYYHELIKKYNSNDIILELIKKEEYKKLKEIIEKTKIDWTKYNGKKITPFHLALENGDSKIVKLLLENGFPIWLPNAKNLTPLELACLNQDPLMITLLIKYNANIKKIILYRDMNRKIHFNNLNFDFILLCKKIFFENKMTPNFRNLTENIKYVGMGEYTWDDFHSGLGIIIKDKFPNLMNWYKEIYHDEKKKFDDREWLNFWILFNFDFSPCLERLFYEEITYIYLHLKKHLKKDILLKLEYKITTDYQKLYSKEFINLILLKWKKINNL